MSCYSYLSFPNPYKMLKTVVFSVVLSLVLFLLNLASATQVPLPRSASILHHNRSDIWIVIFLLIRTLFSESVNQCGLSALCDKIKM